MGTRRGRPPYWRTPTPTPERRVKARLKLTGLTPADGQWLAETLPALQRRARPKPDAVRIEDVVLRHRSGRLGIADALDATADLLEPFAAAGAVVEHRNEWYIDDEEDDDTDEEDDADSSSASRAMAKLLKQLAEAEPDLLVSARMVVDAEGDDAGAAAIYWAGLALANR
jgi:hypothetical protein